MTRAHILYSGRVQGVGFRYTVHRYATDLGLGGWVKNLPSGEVEIIAEGSQDAIEQLLKRIEEHFSGYVKERNITHENPKDNLSGFQIRF